jgi:cleavage stimulation factor subunit 3
MNGTISPTAHAEQPEQVTKSPPALTLGVTDVLADPRKPSSTPDTSAVKSPTLSSRNPLSSIQSARRKRLPQDKVGQLEDRIALDARDADAWLLLIKEYQSKGKLSDARTTFERFFKIFPDLVCCL